MIVRIGIPCLSIGILAGLLGCSKGTTEVKVDDSHIVSLTSKYGQFLGQNKGRGPKDEAEFKKFLAENGVKDDDPILTSPRDKERYGIVYGASANPPAPPGPEGKGGASGEVVVVYERKGVNGKRKVGYLSPPGKHDEVDEETFKRLVPNAN